MSSKSTFESPVNKLPHNLLKEIFIRIRSKNPLYDAQPDTKIAPILLCHVCSSWRAVALTSAQLWSHLYIRLPLSWDKPNSEEREDEDEPTKLTVRSKVAFARDLEFLQWWRANRGSEDLFLRLDVHRRSWHDRSISFNTDLPFSTELQLCTDLALETEDFLFEYLCSAHYLDVGAFHPYLVNQCLRRGFSAPFPSLRTLVIPSCFTRFREHEDEYMPDIIMLPPQIPPTLQRLFIQACEVPRNHNLQDWSVLTHIYLDNVNIFLYTWFTFIRALKNLQCGYFYIICTLPDTIEPTQPLMGVLPKLSALLLDVHISNDEWGKFPLNTLLQNMELPALHTLSLTSSAARWAASRASAEVHNILKAAPAVTKLTLRIGGSRAGFLCFANGDSSELPTVIDEDTERLLTYAPNLSHLQVELRCLTETNVAMLASNYVRLFLLSKRWLDLGNPMCKIRKMTIVIKEIPWDVDSKFEGVFKALLKWYIKKHITANVSFEIVSDTKQGINNFGDAWMPWDIEGLNVI